MGKLCITLKLDEYGFCRPQKALKQAHTFEESIQPNLYSGHLGIYAAGHTYCTRVPNLNLADTRPKLIHSYRIQAGTTY